MFLGVIHNIAILLSLSLIHFLFGVSPQRHYKGAKEVLMGLVIAGVGVLLMMSQWSLQPGVVFDSRSILLSVSGLFFGPIPTIIAMIVTAMYRIYMAGDGIVMGVAVIITSGVTGILWGVFRPNWSTKKRLLELYLMGLLTHFIMAGCIIFLPLEIRYDVFANSSIIIIVLYPLGTLLLGLIMLANTDKDESVIRYKDAEHRIISFFNASKDMMYIKDDKFKYIAVNDPTLDFFQKKRDEILGKSDSELISYGDIDDVEISDIQVLSELKTLMIEARFGNKLYEVTKFPVKLKKENYGIGGVARDITYDVKKRNVHNAILNISKSSLIHTNLKDFLAEVHDKLGKIISADNFYITLYNKEKEEYSYPYFVDESDVLEEGFTESLLGSLTDYVRRRGKSEIINKKIEDNLKEEGLVFHTYGSQSSVWMGAPLFNVDFTEVIGVIVVQDYNNPRAYTEDDLALLEIFANNIGVFIERINNIENLKLAKLKAEESDRLKSSFLANMSHEIRTPMNGIMGFANLLLEEVEDTQHREYLEIISKSADRLLSTINDVLDISRIEAGQVSISKTKFDLNEMLRDIHRFFNGSASKVDFKLSLESIEPFIVFLDKVKLNQVMTNLMGNALKFTKEGCIELGYFTKENNLTIYVKDTGIGIADDMQEVIFERFIQAHTITNEFEGTGLGLSISKLFIEILGGKIWVKSKLGEGSTFFVSFSTGPKD